MSLVQTANAGTGTTANTRTAVYASAQTAGNLNYVVVNWGTSVGAATDTVTVSDTINGSYTAVGSPVRFTAGGAGGDSVQVFYKANIGAASSSANTVTATRSTMSGQAYFTIAIFEQSGLATSSPLDVQVGAGSNATAPTSATSGSVSTTNANDLIIGAFCLFDGPSTVGAGYTSRASFYTVAVGDKTVSSTGSYSATWTSSGTGGWGAQLVAFKLASAGVNQQATATLAPGITEVATSMVNRRTSDTLAPHISAVLTSMVNRRATDTIAPGLTGILTAMANRRAIASLASGATGVFTANVLRRATVSLAPGISIVASVNPRWLGSSTIASASSLTATGIRQIFGSVTVASASAFSVGAFVNHPAAATIASRTTNTATALATHRATDTLAAIIALVGTPAVMRRTSDSIAGSSTATATASLGQDIAASIATRSTLLATINTRFRGASTIASSSAGVLTPQQLRSAVASIASRTTSVNTAQSIKSAAVGITSGIGIAALPVLPNYVDATVNIQAQCNVNPAFGRQLFALLVSTSTVNIAAGAVTSKNAAFVIHKAIANIAIGRQGNPNIRINSKANLTLTPTIGSTGIVGQARNASVNILIGLSTSPRNMTRITPRFTIAANPNTGKSASVIIRPSSGTLATGVISHFQTTMLPHANLSLFERILWRTNAGVASRITLSANPNLSTLGSGRVAIARGITIGATGTVTRPFGAAIATRATVSLGITRVFKRASLTIATGSSLVATGVKNPSQPIAAINSGLTLAANAKLRQGGTVNVVASAIPNLLPRTIISGQGTLNPRISALINTRINRKSPATLTPGITATFSAKSVKSSALIIAGNSSVAATGRGAMNSRSVILAGMNLIVRAFNVTPAPAATITCGSTVTLIPRVVHSAALNLLRGTLINPSNTALRRGSLNINLLGSASPALRATYRGSSGISSGTTVGATNLRSVQASLTINPSMTLANTSQAIHNGTSNVGNGVEIISESRALHLGAVNIEYRLAVILSLFRSIPISTNITSGAAMVAAGEDHFFTGSQANVVGTSPGGIVTTVSPHGIISSP